MTEQCNPSPEIAGKFMVVGVEPGEVVTVTHGRVDLRTIDLATATALVATGNFPYLVAAAQPAPAPAGDETAEAPPAEQERAPARPRSARKAT